jgi:hypothetical protein
MRPGRFRRAVALTALGACSLAAGLLAPSHGARAQPAESFFKGKVNKL